jgi:hypothetical protein
LAVFTRVFPIPLVNPWPPDSHLWTHGSLIF